MARETRSSLWDRLLEATRSSVGCSSAPQQAPAGSPDTMRAAMRSLLLQQGGTDRGAIRLAGAIERSRDLRELWYLRAPLMQAIAREHGERDARHAVAGLDPLFRQAWPQAPVSRRSALG